MSIFEEIFGTLMLLALVSIVCLWVGMLALTAIGLVKAARSSRRNPYSLHNINALFNNNDIKELRKALSKVTLDDPIAVGGKSS
ncbi:MAG: hypothetical protein HKL80_12355 [Acidimicrobiales bacterium]|nr:hypothetical protein [Acidimicrobiales bacterium]